MTPDDTMAEALREVDALTPGSEPMAPPRPPPWWTGIAVCDDTVDDTFTLLPRLGGHRVTREWLEFNRWRMASAIDELDGETAAGRAKADEVTDRSAVVRYRFRRSSW